MTPKRIAEILRESDRCSLDGEELCDMLGECVEEMKRLRLLIRMAERAIKFYKPADLGDEGEYLSLMEMLRIAEEERAEEDRLLDLGGGKDPAP